MTTLIALVALALGILILLQFFHKLGKRVLISHVFSGCLLMYHSAGFLLARFFLAKSDYSSLLLDARIDESDIGVALLWVLGASLFAYALGLVFPAISQIETTRLFRATNEFVKTKAYTYTGAFVLLIETYQISTGGIGIGGIQYNDFTVQVSPVAQFIYPLLYTITYLSGFAVASKSRRKLALGILVPQLFLAFLGGRRAFALALFFLYLGVRLGGVAVEEIKMRHKAFYGAVAVFLFYFGFQFYQAIRNDTLENASNFESLSNAFSKGIERVMGLDRDEEEFKGRVAYNALSRPFIVVYPAMMMRYSVDEPGAKGEVLATSFKLVIPRVFWKGKALFIESDASEERIAYDAFSLPRLQDESNTIVTSGYTDFKYAGIFIYIVLMYSISALLLFIADRFDNLFIYTTINILALYGSIEQCFVDWLGLVRNTLFIILPLMLMYSFFTKTSSRPATLSLYDKT